MEKLRRLFQRSCYEICHRYAHIYDKGTNLSCGFPEEQAPDAYRLLDSFRISSKKEHKQFKSPRAKVLLKGMQIIASLTVGILAWDLKDRATAAKRYREALDLAATHAPFNGPPSSCTNLERWIATDVQATRENLAMLARNDEMNANVIAADGSSAGNTRREEIAVRNTRVEGDGTVNVQDSVSVATDACKNCGKRGLGLRRCSRCTVVKCEIRSFFLTNPLNDERLQTVERNVKTLIGRNLLPASRISVIADF